ncbi:MAG: nitroreductase family deazaflavin-dependent oxidoreductase [Chloroflexota bacterium]|nr:nitroreductase family deazaflavin-dependent oxidoreductase [Chloroflexota bacterium]
MAESWLEALAREDFCYLTTIGRRTGRPHTVEMWFAPQGEAIYLLSGSRHGSDWVRNLRREPAVQVRIGREASQTYRGEARVVDEAAEGALDAVARRLLATKYQRWRPGQPLSEWALTALPVEIQLQRATPSVVSSTSPTKTT